MKLNFSSEYGPEEGVHGDVPQRLFCSETGGEATGTNRPRLGTANVWATEQVAHELMTDTFRAGPRGLPAFLNCCTLTAPPRVPCTWLQTLFRSGVQPS